MIMNFHRCTTARSRLAFAGVAALALLMMAGAATLLTAQEAKQEAKKDDAKGQAAPAAPAAPATEGFKFGVYDGHAETEVGYRWVSDPAGNSSMYRSMINLGDGVKLLHSNVSLRSKYGSGGLFDRFDLSFDNWGGDPYNTMRLNISRSDLYEFRVDYRKLDYFNNIPTYANPLLAKGSAFSQHGLDVAYRSTDLQFKLYPNNKIRPFVGYTRTSGFGPGLTTYSLTGNEFILNTRWNYSSDEYRGGVEISLPTLTLILEQGYRFQKNDTSAYDTYSNSGNLNSPNYLGQPVTLNSLDRGYHDRVSMPVTKLMAKYTPLSMLKFTGRYIYSIADVDSAVNEVRSGSLVSLEDRLYYRSAFDAISAGAKKPNHNGAFAVEFTPFSRLTFLDQFDTKRNHISGDAIVTSTYFNARSLSGGSQVFDAKVTNLFGEYLAYNQTRNQVEADFDLGYGLLVRGGHRYTTVDASLSGTENEESDASSAGMTQQTGILGLAYRPGRRLQLGLNYELNFTDGRLVRTDMLDYNQLKFDWRVDPVRTLSVSGSVSLLSNRPLVDEFSQNAHNRNYTFAVNYEPGERFNFSIDYQRSNILSAINIILPQTLDLDRSYFDELGSSVGGTMGVDLHRGLRADLGYRVILNAGSYPLNFYQPFASLTVPLQNHLSLRAHWQYFGYRENSGSSLQDYRAHLFTIGVAYSR